MFEIVDGNQATGTIIKVIGRRRRRRQRRRSHDRATASSGVEFIAANTDAQALVAQPGEATSSSSARAGWAPARSRRPGARPRSSEREAIREGARRRAHVLHHRRHGRRHRHRRRAGGGRDRARDGHPHRRGGHQAVRLRGQAHADRRGGHGGARRARRLADRDPQREADGGARRGRVDEGRVPRRGRRAVQRGRRDLGDHQLPGPRQRRLRGRAHGDGRDGHGDDGLGVRGRHRPRARRGRAGGGEPAARGHQPGRRARCGGEHHRERRASRCARCTR